MARIDLSNLVQEMTPEQKILCASFYEAFDNRSAANRQIINVVPIAITAPVAASEFLTYAATKLYLCLSIILNYAGAVSNGPVSTTFHDQANVAFMGGNDNTSFWDTVVPERKFYGNDQRINNFYFSRIITNYTYLSFIGYRITLL